MTTPSESQDITGLEKQGWRHFEDTEWDKAIEVFDSILQIDSSNEGALQGRIASLRKEQRFVESHQFLDAALKLRPTSIGILSERAWLYLEQKKHGEAIRAFDEVLQVDRNNESIYLWKIYLLREQRRFEEAERAVQKATDLFAQSTRVLNEQGWLYFYQQQYDEAVNCFERVLATDAGNELALQGKIATLRMQGEYADAHREIEQALKKLPKSIGILSERGWLCFAQARFDEAEAAFEEVLALVPNDPFSCINLAWALVWQETEESYSKATRYCRKALSLNASLAQAYGCLGVVAYKQGHMLLAENYLRRSIRVNPAKGHYVDLGALYTRMERYEEAEEVLAAAVQMNPADANAQMELGNLYLQSGRTKEAVRKFRLAMALDSNNPEAARALAIALMEIGQLVEAEKILRGAIRQLDQTKRRKLHLALCQLLALLGDDTGDDWFFEEALKEVNIAIRLNPQDPDLYFHAGIVRFKLEDYVGALKSFKRCQGANEHHFEAEMNARRITSLIRNEQERSRIGRWESRALALTILGLLIALWILYIATINLVSIAMLLVFSPLLLGCLVVSMLLPWLTRLKITGLEAELSEPKPKEALASGPKGIIGFDTTRMIGGPQ